MNAGTKPFPAWLVALAVLLAATALIATDAGGFAGQLRALELDAYQHFYRRDFVAMPNPTVSLFREFAFVFISGGLLILFFARRYWAAGIALTFVAILAAQCVSWLLFVNRHLVVDSLSPSLALFLTFAAGIAARNFEQAQSRSYAEQAFAGLLPQGEIEKLARRPVTLRPDGETRVVTCLSCGIRHYSTLARSFAENARGFTQLIDNTLAPLIDVAGALGATVGRFDGRSFAAYWNAPLDDTGHALHACDAASRMIEALAAFNEERVAAAARSGAPVETIEVGIGIATGPAIAGLYRVAGRRTYCVTGDSTALAGRIRSLSAQYGPAVILDEETRNALQQAYALLEVDYVACGPGDEPVRLYAMLGSPAMRASPKFRAVATFHEHIFQAIRTQQWQKARALIEQCRKLSGASQQVYDLHLARIAYFEANPPAANWDGAFRPILI
jgi:adenylate cyclase